MARAVREGRPRVEARPVPGGLSPPEARPGRAAWVARAVRVARAARGTRPRSPASASARRSCAAARRRRSVVRVSPATRHPLAGAMARFVPTARPAPRRGAAATAARAASGWRVSHWRLAAHPRRSTRLVAAETFRTTPRTAGPAVGPARPVSVAARTSAVVPSELRVRATLERRSRSHVMRPAHVCVTASPVRSGSAASRAGIAADVAPPA